MSEADDVIVPSNLPQRRLPLGELLVMAGVLDRAALKEALARQRGTRVRLGTVLVEMGVLTESQITQAVAGQLGLHVVDLIQFRPREDALRSVPFTMAKEHGVLPLIIDDANDGGSRLLYAAFSDPTNQRAVNAMQLHTGLRMRPVMIEESTLVAAIDDYYMALREAKSVPAYADTPPLAVGAALTHAVSSSEPEVMTLDAAFITPLEVVPDAYAVEPPMIDLGFENAGGIETLDAAFITPLVADAPTSDAWPATTEPALELALDDGTGSLELDTREAFVAEAAADVSMDMYAMPLDVPDAPVVETDARRGLRAPIDMAEQAPVEFGDDELEEIGDEDVSPVDDGDPFDRSFVGFANDDDGSGWPGAEAAPAVSVDPFFAEPLPSEIVTLAPDQLRALISAAVERGTLDAKEIETVARGDEGPGDR
jgi:hypothetical protein